MSINPPVARGEISRTAEIALRAWIAAGLLSALLYALVPGGVWRGDLPPQMRTMFFASEQVLGQLWCGLVAAAACMAWARRVWLRGLGGALLLALTAFFGLSWGQYLETGYFLGLGGLRMLGVNPWALVQHSFHFHPLQTALAPFAVLAAAAALWIAAGCGAGRGGRIGARLWAGGWAILFLAVYASQFLSLPWRLLPFDSKLPYRRSEAGEVSTVGDHLNELYYRKNGPFSTLASDLFLRRQVLPDPDPHIAVEWRPQVSLEKYLEGVRPEKIARRNVLLILVESLRADELRSGGSPRVVMPTVEALAGESVYFTNNYTTASHSNYADLGPLSSHYPLRSPSTHVYPARPPYPRVLIYDVLKARGWRTGIVSSQNENWGAMANYLRTPGLDTLWHSENFDGATYTAGGDIGFAGMRKKSGKVDDRFTVDRAIKWIDADRSAPFFLYMNLQNSHFPFEVGEGFARRFGADKIDFEPKFSYLAPEQVPVMRERYRDSLAYSDAQLARLFDHLKAIGQWDNTVVVLSGDTGQAFMEHGFSGHANRLYDEVLHTPLLIRSPGRPASVSRVLAQHVDVPPTVLSELGFPVHPSFQGMNLFAMGAETTRDVFLTAQTPLAEQFGIVRGGFKYLALPYSSEEWLFDLRDDPGETKNLARSRPEIAAGLKRRLDTWRAWQLSYYRDADRYLMFYPPVLSRDDP